MKALGEVEEMEELLRTLVNTQILKAYIENNVGKYMFTIVPAFFTCFGISFRNILFFFRFDKNRNACKYVILNKIRDESLINYMKKVLVFGFELYIFLINMPVMIGVAELFILFANMRTGVISYNISYSTTLCYLRRDYLCSISDNDGTCL